MPDRRGTILPILGHPDGSWDWAAPQIALDAYDAFSLPGDVYQGKIDPQSEEGMRRTLGLASMMSGGTVFGTAERVAPRSLGAMVAKGPMEYDPPRYPQRPFKADYPGEVQADAAGKLQTDIDGRALTARYIAGRTEARLPDRPIGPDDLAGIGQGLLGEGAQSAPRQWIGGLGGTAVDDAGQPRAVYLADDLHPDDVPRVLGHETGHVIDQVAGAIPIDGLTEELTRNYDRLATGNRWSTRLTGPRDYGYPEAQQPRELMVEAVRAYMADPNYVKSAMPQTAARIREYVNSNPRLKDTIQFNQGGAPGLAAGIAASGGNSVAEIRVQGPDGSSFTFPEGTPGDVISSAMQKHYGAPSPALSSRPQEVAPELDPATGMPAGMVLDPKTGQVIDTNARAELLRREGGAMQNASDMAGQFVAGTPIVGEFLDEAAGAIGGDMMRENARAKLKSYEEANPGTSTALRVAGGINGTIPMLASGASFAANAAAAGGGLGRVAAGSAVDGMIAGAAAGVGAGQGAEGRLWGAGVGAAGGGILGGAAPLAVAGTSAMMSPLVAPIMSRLRPEGYANSALGEALKRAGLSPDEIATALSQARADGQGGFAVADAMGNSGQRMLSTVARTPNDARQGVIEGLQQRQSGQGERLSNALAEGFAAPDTAAQRTATLTNARTSEANQLYGDARRNAGAVDVTPILREIDAVLSPGASGLASPRDRIAPDTIEGALGRVRSMLSDGRSNVSNFNSLFRVKLDLDDMIQRADAQGAGNRAHALSNVHRQVDAALGAGSPEYAAARDAFAAASRRIEAIGTGTSSASGRTRAPDNMAVFQAMTPEEQSAFRAGYVDPMISRVEAASSSPTTNKARGLITEKTAQEFPAFAAPGQGEMMGRRIGREQTMFETASAALGGSKTADNLADAAEMSKFDPSVMAALFQGRPIQAGLSAVARALNEGRGMPPVVLSKVAAALMQTDPTMAREALAAAQGKTTSASAARSKAIAVMNALGGSAAGRLSAP